jgi:enamine deaminase RidA (YjgF/YER057c/UK114 family)
VSRIAWAHTDIRRRPVCAGIAGKCRHSAVSERSGKIVALDHQPPLTQEKLTMNTSKIVRPAMRLAALATAAAILSPAAMAQTKPVDTTPSKHLEVIHHPNYDKTVFMPFVPAIKIKSGKILWLAGGTALPVYHDHPHKRDQLQKYMVNDLEQQTRQAMDGIKQTVEAAGGSMKDVVHLFIFRARPRMGDIGRASFVVNEYFKPHNHKPTTTNLAVLELGEPEQLAEIQAFAVID